MAGPTGQGCPACGAPIPPLAATCESCGYAFGSMSASTPDAVARAARDGPDRAGSSDGPADAETGPCRRCGGTLPVDARYCRHCGHAVREWRIVPVLLMILGFCLTASIIGAVLGVPMQVLALRLFREARDGTVVAD